MPTRKSRDVEAASTHWRAASAVPPAVLPADALAGEVPRAARVAVALSEAETRAMLQDVPKSFRTQINDVLLAGLARALQHCADGRQFRIDLEGHGREHIADDVDVSRTVGWFTTLFPVVLDVRNGGDAIDGLLAVRDRLREIPHRGMSYGLLRYAANDESVRSALASAPPASILFNYLGQFDAVVADSRVFAFADESTGPWRSPRARRTHALEIVGLVRGGRLEIEWNYDAAVHREATIARAADDMLAALRAVLAAAASGTRAFHAGRFPAGAARSQRARPPCARYPDARGHLSADADAAPVLRDGSFRRGPWLRAMAVPHRRRDRRGVLRRAIEWTVARHTMLRTAFVDDGGDQPLQIVLRSAPLPWREEDWRGIAAGGAVRAHREPAARGRRHRLRSCASRR